MCVDTATYHYPSNSLLEGRRRLGGSSTAYNIKNPKVAIRN